MRFILLPLICMYCTNGFGQKPLDSIATVIPESKFLSLYQRIGPYCIGEEMEVISAPELVWVYDFEECKNGISFGLFFKTIYQGKTVLIDSREITNKEEAKSAISKVASDTRLRFRDTLEKYHQSLARIDSLLKQKRKLEFQKKILTGQKNGIMVLSWEIFDQSEYTEGTGSRIEVYNPGKKRIKYLWFTITGYNAVDDIISTKIPKGIGPIEPGNAGKYEYDYVWFTDLVRYAKINSIKIQYFDGTSKTITDVNAIRLTEDEYESLSEIREIKKSMKYRHKNSKPATQP